MIGKTSALVSLSVCLSVLWGNIVYPTLIIKLCRCDCTLTAGMLLLPVSRWLDADFALRNRITFHQHHTHTHASGLLKPHRMPHFLNSTLSLSLSPWSQPNSLSPSFIHTIGLHFTCNFDFNLRFFFSFAKKRSWSQVEIGNSFHLLVVLRSCMRVKPFSMF